MDLCRQHYVYIHVHVYVFEGSNAVCGNVHVCLTCHPVNPPSRHAWSHCRVDIHVKEANFPRELMTIFIGHIHEMLHQCVEPPLIRKPM